MKKGPLILSTVGLVGMMATLAPTVLASSDMNTYIVSYQGQNISQPQGFITDDTTYMPVDEIVKALKTMNLSAAWYKNNLVIGTPLPVDLPDIPPTSNRKAHIYLKGHLFASVPLIRITNQPTQTAYLPIWYVMQALNKMGQDTHWNGHQWNLDSSPKVTSNSIFTSSSPNNHS